MDTVLLVIIAAIFALAGAAKILGLGPIPANFERYVAAAPGNLKPVPARIVVGIVEFVIVGFAIAGLTGSVAATQLAGVVALWTMVGALVAHGMAGDPPRETAPALVVLLLAAGLLATTV